MENKPINWWLEGGIITNYQSDFSAGADGWTGNNMTVSGNNDGISDGSTSYDNVLKAYATITNSTHEISKSIAFTGKLNMITLRYYIPTGQTNVNDIRVYANVFGLTVLDVASFTVGSWQEVTSSYFTPTSAGIAIRAMKTFTTSYAGAGSASDDILYFQLIKEEYQS